MSFLPTPIHEHFAKNDPTLFKWIAQIEAFELVEHQNYFEELSSSIVSQQLSTKVADVIWGRLIKLFPEEKVTPEIILQLSEADLRAVGLSFAKIKYIKDLATRVLNGDVHLEKISKLSDEEIIVELTKVKGIGKWTAEMFLMFTLARPNVFSHGDLGLKKGIQKVYELAEMPTEEEMLELEKNWQPYKTYASRILWKSLESGILKK